MFRIFIGYLVLEAAYRSIYGWGALNGGGSPATILRRLTGVASQEVQIGPLTLAQLQNTIQTAWNANQLLCLSSYTASEVPNWTLPNGVILTPGHAYVVTEVWPVGVTIYNTWGYIPTTGGGSEPFVTLTWAEIQTHFWRISID